MCDIVIILVIKSKYISGNRVTYMEFKLQLDVDLIYVLSGTSGFGVSSVHNHLFIFLTNCTHEFWGNLMLFHGILQNIIPIVMKSTSKIIKLDGADIVYLFDEVGYFVGLPV